jgi:N-acetylmuramoyl-L-alanine amidase
MARLIARGLLFALAALTGCTAPAQPPAAALKPVPVQPAAAPAKTEAAPVTWSDPPAKAEPVRVAPTRPAHLWAFTRLRGTDYVSVRDLAARFNLKATWTKPELAMTLADARGVRLTFETNQTDFYFDGLRVFLGEPVLVDRDSLWVSKLDLIKLVVPLLHPEEHLSQLPATPPRIIVLDPGHGGNDPGKENKLLGINEKTFTLDVALRLKKILEIQGWQVLLTRNDDHELSPIKKKDLQMRDEFANSNRADLFLSIHFNSVEKASERVTGVETYTMSPQFMFSAADAKKDDMTDTAFPGNRFDYGNLLFGEQIHRAMIAGLKSPDRGFKRGRLAVLRFVECPGALVECAYLSNVTEARRVATPEYRQQIAEAIATGVQGYAATLAALRPLSAPAAK